MLMLVNILLTNCLALAVTAESDQARVNMGSYPVYVVINSDEMNPNEAESKLSQADREDLEFYLPEVKASLKARGYIPQLASDGEPTGDAVIFLNFRITNPNASQNPIQDKLRSWWEDSGFGDRIRDVHLEISGATVQNVPVAIGSQPPGGKKWLLENGVDVDNVDKALLQLIDELPTAAEFTKDHPLSPVEPLPN